jgi:hypothetical protein
MPLEAAPSRPSGRVDPAKGPSEPPSAYPFRTTDRDNERHPGTVPGCVFAVRRPFAGKVREPCLVEVASGSSGGRDAADDGADDGADADAAKPVAGGL